MSENWSPPGSWDPRTPTGNPRTQASVVETSGTPGGSRNLEEIIDELRSLDFDDEEIENLQDELEKYYVLITYNHDSDNYNVTGFDKLAEMEAALEESYGADGDGFYPETVFMYGKKADFRVRLILCVDGI